VRTGLIGVMSRRRSWRPYRLRGQARSRIRDLADAGV